MTETIDQIRARFQPRTRGGDTYEIFAERDGILYGRFLDSIDAQTWDTQGKYHHGPDGDRKRSPLDLIPRSPHDELISRARDYLFRSDLGEKHDIISALCDALEQKESTK